MRFSTLTVAAVAATGAHAQSRPSDVPICDFYTTALFKENNATNQLNLLTALVNTVVIGNYTQNKTLVPGILAPAKVNGEDVNLLQYFDGTLVSTNSASGKPQSLNFLDGGGAAPLKENKPANDDKSRQFFLLTHLYQFFGALLGCSKQGMPGFDKYTGHASMYQVHKFMDLDINEVTYFVQQVGAAAASFGVAEDDITAVAGALNGAFNVRCAPKTTIIKEQGEQLQSICVADNCKLADKSDCSLYTDKLEEPASVSGTGATTPGATSTSPAPTGSSTAPAGTGAGAVHGFSIAAAAAAVAAYIL